MSDPQARNKVETHVIELPSEYYPDGMISEGEVLYCVSVNGKILKTPKGTPITNQLRRPLRQLANEIENEDSNNPESTSLYGLCSIQLDSLLFDEGQYSLEYFQNLVQQDMFLEFILNNITPLFMSRMAQIHHYLDYLSVGFRRFMNESYSYSTETTTEPRTIGKAELLETLANRLYETFKNYSVYERTVFLASLEGFNSCLLANILASSFINPRELSFVYSAQKETKDSSDSVLKKAECLRTYLELFPPRLSRLEQMIQNGESKNLEFKSTLRWNIRAGKEDTAMEHAVLKSVAAFLNTDGGTLLVGVEDNGNVLGIGPDKFPNEDKYLLHFANLLNNRIGKEFGDLVKWDLEPAFGKKVLKVDCQKSPNPAFLKNNSQDEFFIRTGPSTVQLSLREVLDYIKRRFNQ